MKKLRKDDVCDDNRPLLDRLALYYAMVSAFQACIYQLEIIISQVNHHMTESQKKRLEQQLWNIANELRGKMNADEFRDYGAVEGLN